MAPFRSGEKSTFLVVVRTAVMADVVEASYSRQIAISTHSSIIATPGFIAPATAKRDGAPINTAAVPRTSFCGCRWER